VKNVSCCNSIQVNIIIIIIRYKGGFSKVPSAPPDILHSFYSICWLSLYYHENIKIVGSDFKNDNENENLKNENNLQDLNSIDIRFALCEKRLPLY
jgi:prenyltransferase beta subunit